MPLSVRKAYFEIKTRTHCKHVALIATENKTKPVASHSHPRESCCQFSRLYQELQFYPQSWQIHAGFWKLRCQAQWMKMSMLSSQTSQDLCQGPPGLWGEGSNVGLCTHINRILHVTLCIALGKDFNLWNSSLKITTKICMTCFNIKYTNFSVWRPTEQEGSWQPNGFLKKQNKTNKKPSI